MASLAVENLSFSYGKRSVLRDVSFTANPGDFIAVLGPNGVGKSTMFRCILGFLDRYQGSISIDGVDARSLSRKELASRVAYIPQSSSLVFDYSVIELVLMGSTVRLGMLENPGKEEEARALEILEGLGIAHLAYQGCCEISGGEYQLVMLARALMQGSSILVMDEPVANLDYGNQFRVMEKIGSFTSKGYIILMSAHDPNLVLRHANRALVVEHGTVRADGAPSDIMTDELLSSLYRIPIGRFSLEGEGQMLNVCVPLAGRSSTCEGGV